MTKRSDADLRREIRKIYDRPRPDTQPRPLNIEPFLPALAAFSPARRAELEPLIAPATIPELLSSMEVGRFSSEELTLYYLERIRRLDLGRLNSVTELNPDALTLARALDQERREGQRRGPLHGVPILLKDNIATADGMHTTAGARILETFRAPRDSFIAARLREAGAVLLGKTALSEWANYMGREMPSGFSAVGGQVRNPYGRFVVWGSSTGSAVAVSAGLAAAAIGTETAGSIVAPSSQHSTFGLKPSLGLLSRTGIIPLASAQDTPGPITRSMIDLALLMQVLAGADPADPVTASAAELAGYDYLSALNPGGLKGVRVGLMRSRREEVPEDTLILDRAEEILRTAGAVVVPLPLPARLPHDVDFGAVLAYSFREELGQFLRDQAAPVQSLEEIIAYNRQALATRAPWGQENLEHAQTIQLSPEAFAEKVRLNREATRRAIHAKLAGAKVSLTLSLANYYSAFYAIAGYPALCVPGGFRSTGEPVGVTFSAGFLSEPLLIRAAAAFEQARPLRQAPPQEVSYDLSH